MHNMATVKVSTNGQQSWQMAYQRWLPESKPLAIILVVHGLAEHGGRYDHVARFFNTCGYAAYAMDHIGHGSSPGEPGQLKRFSQFLDGVTALRDVIKTEHQQLPVVILGHSLGGLIAANYLLENDSEFSGCILSGPAIIVPDEPSKLLLMINKALATLAPKTGMLQLDANGISRDPEVVQKYRDDPLVFNGKISARFIDEMFSAMAKVRNNAAQISLPLFIMHGEEDQLTSAEGSKELYALATSKSKTLKIYPELYHEIFNEPEQEKVLNDLKKWIMDHLST